MKFLKKYFLWVLAIFMVVEHQTKKSKNQLSYFDKIRGMLGIKPSTSLVGGGSVSIDSVSSVGIDGTRQNKLIEASRNLFESMKGLGGNKQLFFSAILDIKTDGEFNFVESKFLQFSNGKSLRKMIKQQNFWINQKVIDSVNSEFAKNNMSIRLTK